MGGWNSAGRARKGTSLRSSSARRLRCEVLESRRVLAASLESGTVIDDEPGLSSAAADGSLLYAIDRIQDVLTAIDPSTGADTPVGSVLPGPASAGGLAWDGTEMWTIDASNGGLYTLDLTTGAATKRGDTFFTDWGALASDPTDGGQLYGLTEFDFYRIAPDGALSFVGGAPEFVYAMEFDDNGVLWGSTSSEVLAPLTKPMDGSRSSSTPSEASRV